MERFAYFKRFDIGNVSIDREIPRCISACPAGCDVRSYIKLISERKYEEAYEKIRETVPFPATIGRICYHPCEDACRRNFYDEPVAIAALKRFVGDSILKNLGKLGQLGQFRNSRQQNTNFKDEGGEREVREGREGREEREKHEEGRGEMREEGREESAESGESGKRVAVIGAGPAGLTFAYRLAKKGHRVKIFERLPVAGGMLSAGIPEYRLPRDVLNAEISHLIEEVRDRVEVEYGVDVDKDKFREICDNYDAVFISVGAHKSRKLGIEGEDLKGVMHGVDFLREFNFGRKFEEIKGKRVIVIGGGNVAMDVARTSLRIGADVTVAYRRSREEMPAREEEVEEAEEEGVKFMFLVNPVRIIGDDEGKVRGIEMIRMRLGAPDETGRRRPEPIKGSEFKIDSDFVIIAIGQYPDLSFVEDYGIIERGLIKTDENGYTGVKNIFAGGDCVRGPSFAIDAIADANRAAEAVHNMLTGKTAEEAGEEKRVKAEERVGAVFSGTSVAGITPVEAVKTPEDAEERISEELRLEEAFGILKHEKRREMPTLDLSERVRGFSEIYLGFSEEDALSEAERCLRCRGCMLSVPAAEVSVEKADLEWELEKTAFLSGVNKCAECGECTAACPVTALEPRFSPRRIAGMSLMERASKLIEAEEIWLCVSCGICNAICPYGVDFVRFLQGTHKFAFILGNLPHYQKEGCVATVTVGTVTTLNEAESSSTTESSTTESEHEEGQEEQERSKAKAGKSAAEMRFRWLRQGDGLKVAERGDVYYFAGCLSLLADVYAERENLRLEEIARSAVRLLNEVGVVPAISKDEQCCGHDLLWAGDEKRFRELMRANIEAIKKSGAKIVVFTCAECLRTFEIDYRRFAAEENIEMGFKCMHLSEFLIERGIENVLKSRLESKFESGQSGKSGQSSQHEEQVGEKQILTYHDPCRLRHLSIYEAPREILRMLKSVELREMEHAKERGLCCGVSAMLTCGPVARAMQMQRLKEAERVNAEKIVVACPKCWVHLDCAASSLGVKTRIEDFTITVADALFGQRTGE